MFIASYLVSRPTVCVSRWWAGVDSAWEQKNPKPERCLKTAQNPTSRLHALFGGVPAVNQFF
jgi:hypothetical protein